MSTRNFVGGKPLTLTLRRAVLPWLVSACLVSACDRASVVAAPHIDQEQAQTTGSSTGSPTGSSTGSATGGDPQAVTVTLTANGQPDHLVVPQGTSTTLQWTSQNATSCAMTSQLGSTGAPQSVSWGNTLAGSQAVTPTEETIFVLTCSNSKSSASAKVDLFVSFPCNGNGKTIIQALTKSITNNASNQLMQYALSYVDCNGNPAPFPDAPVWFDYNGYEVSNVNDLAYTITTSDGSVNVNGSMAPVWGEDLFGHTGSNYFHYLTDKSIGIPAGVSSFKFTVDMSETETHLVRPSRLNPPPAREVINTFLRIGNSEPDVAPVTFVNQ